MWPGHGSSSIHRCSSRPVLQPCTACPAGIRPGPAAPGSRPSAKPAVGAAGRSRGRAAAGELAARRAALGLVAPGARRPPCAACPAWASPRCWAAATAAASGCGPVCGTRACSPSSTANAPPRPSSTRRRLMQAYRAHADELYIAMLRATSSRGSWSGHGIAVTAAPDADGPVAALTRASIRLRKAGPSGATPRPPKLRSNAPKAAGSRWAWVRHRCCARPRSASGKARPRWTPMRAAARTWPPSRRLGARPVQRVDVRALRTAAAQRQWKGRTYG